MGMGSLAPLLTEEWDNDCDYENLLINQIKRCGYISEHPDAWGAHDNPYEPYRAVKDIARWRDLIASDRVERRKINIFRVRDKSIKSKAAHRLYLRREAGCSLKVRLNAYRGFECSGFDQRTRDEAFELLETFPHTNNIISNQVAREFVVGGYKDAGDRKIDNVTWLWKRSRMLNLELAGLK